MLGGYATYAGYVGWQRFLCYAMMAMLPGWLFWVR
jgi:hypothetical protein